MTQSSAAESISPDGPSLPQDNPLAATGILELALPRGCQDDVANAAAGALVYAYAGSGYSPQQRLRDSQKIAEHYKRLAKSIV
jgi:hypothetical protein